MKRLPFLLSLIILIASCSKPSEPVLELSSLIGDGMVLQQNADVTLWGHINPGKKIEITTSWGIRLRVKADNGRQLVSQSKNSGGRWSL